MKKFLLAALVLSLGVTVWAQGYGLGLFLETEVLSVNTENVEPIPNTMDKVTSATTMIKGYYFTPGDLEFNIGAGFKLENQEDPSDVNDDLIEEFIQGTVLLSAGVNRHFINTRFVNAGLGLELTGYLALAPDGADALDYTRGFNDTWRISLPVFADIKMTDHILTRLSMNALSLSIQHSVIDTGSGATVNSNILILDTGVLRYGAAVALIFRF